MTQITQIMGVITDKYLEPRCWNLQLDAGVVVVVLKQQAAILTHMAAEALTSKGRDGERDNFLHWLEVVDHKKWASWQIRADWDYREGELE